MTASEDVTASCAAAETTGYSKATRRLIPLLFVCYVFAYLDRVNVGFAKLEMLAELGFSETVYGLGAGVFFLGYFAFEVPSNLVLTHVGARRWIARIMISWGLVASLMMFVRTPAAFYFMRFLLGAAEAGFIPGILLYLSRWYPAPRRGRVMAYFLTGIPISGVLGGPLSGWILTQFDGVNGWSGWQWLFLLEGIPSVFLGLCILKYLPDGIDSASWLLPQEKLALAARVSDEDATKSHVSIRDAFTEGRVWLLSIIYLLFLMGLYAFTFWLPSLLKASGVTDSLRVGLYSAIPYTVATVAMLATSYSSDAHRERRWHLAVPGVIGALGLVLSVLHGNNVVLALATLTLAAAGICTTVSQFWNIPSAFLAGSAAAAGIAMINSIGNVAGFASPYLVGWVQDSTGHTDNAVLLVAGCVLAASVLVFVVPARLVNR